MSRWVLRTTRTDPNGLSTNGSDGSFLVYPDLSWLGSDGQVFYGDYFPLPQAAATSSSVAITSGGITITLEYDAHATAAPASFRAGIEQAATLIAAAISDHINIHIIVEYEGTGGGAAAGPYSGLYVNYSQVRSTLISNATSGDTIFNALPNSASIQGQSQVAVWNSQLKALGMMSANAATIDGTSTYATDISTNQLVGVALHEITHAMGRVPYSPQPGIFDLFRFTAPGVRLFDGGATGPASYFSVDGGVTKLADYGQYSDTSDFLNSGVQGSNDAFNEYYGSSSLQTLSLVDLMQMDALGFHLTSSDITRPTISITSNKTVIKAGETATITFTLSESSTTFALADVVATGGVLSNFAGSGAIYTATFTPPAGSNTDGVISVASTTFTDAAGNSNADGSDANNRVTITVDMVLPTIAITSNKTALKSGDTATITFTLSESSTTFTASDIVVSGGTLSNFVNFMGNGVTYTATFTPDIGSTYDGMVSVANTTFTDAAGNNNADGSDANNRVTMTVDTVLPTIAITSNKAVLKVGDTATITFTLSESSTTFALGDVVVTGGALSNFAGSGASYTATFTPTVGSTASGVVSVASTTFTDAAGNNNADGSDANNRVTMAVDAVLPTISITSNKATLKAGETATITFTLSESSTTFALADVVATGGALSNFSGSGAIYMATFTPTSGSTASGVVSVASTTFTDAAGNSNADGSDANNQVTMTVDTISPAIAITSYKTALRANETALIAFTLSESSTTFTVGDVVATGGTLSNFAGSGASYTATFTPTVGSTTGVVSVASNTFTDAAGVSNVDGADADNRVTLTLDTMLPTIAITRNKSVLKVGETATITFTLSESSTTFTVGDVVATGGILSNFSGSGTDYTATFTPTSGSTTNGVVSVASNSFTDAAGNNNADGSDANNRITMTVDTVLPTIAISSNKTALKVGETALITFTLSESSATFTVGDVVATGGALSNFSGSGASYTATFTPTAGSSGSGVVSVASGAFTGASGNSNTDGADANNTITMTMDTGLPTISITTDKAALKMGETATITFTLSESSTTFVSSDIAITGGTLSGFAGSGISYTAIFTPNTESIFSGVVSVASNAFTDAGGNSNADGSDADNRVTMTIDTHAPTASTFSPADAATGVTVGSNIVVTFSEAVQFITGSIGIHSGSATGTLIESYLPGSNSISIIGSELTINPTSSLAYNTRYFVTFSPGAIKDLAGNSYSGISTYDFTTGSSPDSTNPTVWAFSPADAATSVTVVSNIVVTFSEAIQFGIGYIEIHSGSAAGTVIASYLVGSSSNLSINGSILTINPTSELAYNTHYFVTFPAGSIRDLAGNGYAGTSSYDFTTAAATPLTLTGDGLSNSLIGADQNDIITGLGGIDTLDGRGGSDLYIMTVAADHKDAEINDTGGSGTDEVRFTSTVASTLTLYALDRGIETVVIGTGTDANAISTGTKALNVDASAVTNALTMTGNAGNNILKGGSGNDTLNGGAGIDALSGGLGNDSLIGGAGIDIFTVGSGTDSIVDLGEGGADVLIVSSGATANAIATASWIAPSFSINSGTVNMSTNGFSINLSAVTSGNGFTVTNLGAANTMIGSGRADTLIGGVGSDTLMGGAGIDTLVGGLGDDVYIIDSTTDTIVELTGEGTDTVQSSVAFSLSSIGYVENLTLTGSAFINGTGNSLDNVLIGNGGANTLDGGDGVDTLMGGLGNDFYVVDSVTDNITELMGGGTDTIQSSVTYSLVDTNGVGIINGDNVENLTLTGSGNINGTGNILKNIIIGNSGNNILDGGAGNDTFIGGSGDDTLIGGDGIDTFTVGSGIDSITDLGVGGADVLTVSLGATANATVMAAWTATFASINSGTENIITNGSVVNLAAVVSGNGFSITNTGNGTTLTGSGLADRIIGGTGNDILKGGRGSDSITGGAGKDTFVFSSGDSGQATNFDLINDYTKGTAGTGDLIDFSSILSIGGSIVAATSTQASINQTTGIATFAVGSGTTLSDAISDIATRFTAATNASGEFSFFQVGNTGDYYLFISDGTAGVTANDTVINLVGISSISTINMTGGNLTITG